MTSAAPIYRSLMVAIEARRLELGISMSTVDDVAGLQDGYYAKMIYPDTPSGRQARWETVQLAIEALFGRDFQVAILGDGPDRPSTLSLDKGASHKYLKIRHWRHSAHFKELGRLGGLARAKSLDSKRLRAIAKKGARALKRARAAQRQGEQHKRENQTKRQRQEAAT